MIFNVFESLTYPWYMMWFFSLCLHILSLVLTASVNPEDRLRDPIWIITVFNSLPFYISVSDFYVCDSISLCRHRFQLLHFYSEPIFFFRTVYTRLIFNASIHLTLGHSFSKPAFSDCCCPLIAKNWYHLESHVELTVALDDWLRELLNVEVLFGVLTRRDDNVEGFGSF